MSKNKRSLHIRLVQGVLTGLAASLTWCGVQSHAAESGLPACPGVGETKLLLGQQGALESLAFDNTGRLLF
jgi:hypothetical protein